MLNSARLPCELKKVELRSITILVEPTAAHEKLSSFAVLHLRPKLANPMLFTLFYCTPNFCPKSLETQICPIPLDAYGLCASTVPDTIVYRIMHVVTKVVCSKVSNYWGGWYNFEKILVPIKYFNH